MRWKEGQALFSFFSIIYSLYTSATFHSTLSIFYREGFSFFSAKFPKQLTTEMRWKGGGGTSSGLLWLPTVHPSTRRTCGHKMKVFPISRQKTPFGDKMSFCQFLGKRLPINTIGGNPCRCWSGVSGSIKLPDYKTFSGMNTGGRGGGRGGAQTKTSHKIFLLEKHKVLSFSFLST